MRLVGQDFHLYRIQERINDSMQPTHREEPTSRLRRHVMANRIMTQQNPGSSMLFRRRENVSFQNSVFLRRQLRFSTQPFGSLVPEQHGAASLSHHAAPLGKDTVYRDEDLDCEVQEACISGDSDSEKSIEQSRRRSRTTSFHHCRNVDCLRCEDYSPMLYHHCLNIYCAWCENYLPLV